MPRTHKPNLGRGTQAQMWRAALGSFIAELRRERGMRQEDLAAAIGTSGAMLSSIECGRSTVSPDYYKSLCDALKVSDQAFGRVILRCQDPALYGLLYGSDPQLEAELQRSKRAPRVMIAYPGKDRSARRQPCKTDF